MQRIFGPLMALVISVLFLSSPAFAEWDPQVPTPEQTREMLAPPSIDPETPPAQNLIYQSGVNPKYNMDWQRLEYLKALIRGNFELCQELYTQNEKLLLVGTQNLLPSQVLGIVLRELQADVLCLTAKAQALEYERLIDDVIPRYIRRLN